MLKRRTKARLAATAAKEMIEHPTVRYAAKTVATPIAKRQLRKRRRRAARRGKKAARTANAALANYGPSAAEALGMLEQAKKKKAAGPRVAVGVALGAGAMYLLEPDHGRERRQQVRKLIASVK